MVKYHTKADLKITFTIKALLLAKLHFLTRLNKVCLTKLKLENLQTSSF